MRASVWKIAACLVTVVAVGSVSFGADIFTGDAIDDGSIPHGGSTVLAFGWGDSFFSLSSARVEASNDLMADRARIEAGLRPGLTVNWGQISETTASNWGGWTVFLSQVGTVQNPNGGNAQQELAQILQLLEEAMGAAEEEHPWIGWGWTGNVTRLGPECDEVHDFFNDYVDDHDGDIDYEHYEIVTLFEAGPLPWDLAAHVYFGIQDPETGEIIYVFDPWRYGNVDPIDPDDNPNGDPEDTIPW